MINGFMITIARDNGEDLNIDVESVHTTVDGHLADSGKYNLRQDTFAHTSDVDFGAVVASMNGFDPDSLGTITFAPKALQDWIYEGSQLTVGEQEKVAAAIKAKYEPEEMDVFPIYDSVTGIHYSVFNDEGFLAVSVTGTNEVIAVIVNDEGEWRQQPGEPALHPEVLDRISTAIESHYN